MSLFKNANQIKLNQNQIFYSPHKIHIVYSWYICTYTDSCLMWRACREARHIMLLAIRYHTCSFPVPRPIGVYGHPATWRPQKHAVGKWTGDHNATRAGVPPLPPADRGNFHNFTLRIYINIYTHIHTYIHLYIYTYSIFYYLTCSSV